MATLAEPEDPPVSLRRRVYVVVGLLALVAVALLVARVLVRQSTSTSQLHQLERTIDETDPPWRLNEIEAARPEVPPKENSALLVVEVVRMIGRTGLSAELEKVGEGVELPAALPAEQLATLDRELGALAPAVAAARRLAELPRGRHRLVIPANPFLTRLEDQQNTRRVSWLLVQDALHRASKGDQTGALASCRAILNTARSIGDEPLVVSQIIRLAIVLQACRAIERTLSLGPGVDAELGKLDELLKEEEAFPGGVLGLRGDRAATYALLKALSEGRLSVAESLDGRFDHVLVWRERLAGWELRHQLYVELPTLVALANEGVEVARQPPHEQHRLELALDAKAAKMKAETISLKALGLSYASLGEKHRQKLALVRVTRGLIAVERHRLAKGALPATLEEVLPGLLDPFDGKPLRYVRTAEGVTVYSVGSDLKDDGGAVQGPSPSGLRGDIGHRVWDVERRGKR